jgi:ubiquinone biosynthesis UbiH/UbiF/VisC/COQ6 family hydroxylase
MHAHSLAPDDRDADRGATAPAAAAPDRNEGSPPVDVAIVGAGPTGLALAAAAADAGLSVTIVERQARAALAAPAPDGREIALTHRAEAILRGLGIRQRFPESEVAPLREARVVDGDSPFALRFDPRRSHADRLGWLVPNHVIRRAALEAVLERPGVVLADSVGVSGAQAGAASGELVLDDGGRVRARLIVAADSRFSAMRRAMGIGARMTDFGRVAIVCRLRHALPNRGIAHECFRYGDTLAMLPLNGDRVSAVVTVPADRAPELMTMSPDAFADRVRRRFDDRLGEMTLEGDRHAYPLVATFAHRFVGRRFALAGDAAVGMHPVTAHGFNFGLYGVDALVRAIRRHGAGDPGTAAALHAYESEHRRVTLPVWLGTNAVVSLFTDDRAPARLARGALLRVAERLAPLKAGIETRLTGVPRPT